MPLHLIRPQTLAEFHGNNGLKAALESKFSITDRPRTYLFHGSAGCGKTTLAQIVARAYGCNMDKDYQEYDIGDARGIDDARAIKQNIHYAPMGGGPVKVYVLDEVHASNSFFQDALLKVLEEPPKHVVFILCTTNPEKLKTTVKRRCTQLEVRPLDTSEMQGLILKTLAGQGITQGYPQVIIDEIIRTANGSPGIALNILDQVIDMEDQAQIIATVRRTEVTEASVIDLCRALLARNWDGTVAQLRLMPRKAETEPVRQAIMSYMMSVVLGDRPNPQAAAVMMIFEKPFFDSDLRGLVARCLMAMRG